MYMIPWDPKTLEIADTLEKTSFTQKSELRKSAFPRSGKVYQQTIKCCGHPGQVIQSQRAFFRTCALSLFS